MLCRDSLVLILPPFVFRHWCQWPVQYIERQSVEPECPSATQPRRLSGLFGEGMAPCLRRRRDKKYPTSPTLNILRQARPELASGWPDSRLLVASPPHTAGPFFPTTTRCPAPNPEPRLIQTGRQHLAIWTPRSCPMPWAMMTKRRSSASVLIHSFEPLS